MQAAPRSIALVALASMHTFSSVQLRYLGNLLAEL